VAIFRQDIQFKSSSTANIPPCPFPRFAQSIQENITMYSRLAAMLANPTSSHQINSSPAARAKAYNKPLASPASSTHLTSNSIAFHKARQNDYILVACHVCFWNDAMSVCLPACLIHLVPEIELILQKTLSMDEWHIARTHLSSLQLRFYSRHIIHVPPVKGFPAEQSTHCKLKRLLHLYIWDKVKYGAVMWIQSKVT
jgi:hypothetical protein